MDNNVSNNTIDSKFLTLQFTKENNLIGIKRLLTEQILISLRLYRQSLNIDLNLEFISRSLERKITLFLSTEHELSLKTLKHNYFPRLSTIFIGYGCPIALALACRCQLSPLIIARSLRDILIANADRNHHKSIQLTIEVTKSGWLNFYLSERAIELWLNHLSAKASISSKIIWQNYALTSTPVNVFPIQYAHARCCSLLRLGARAKLIILRNDNFQDCRLKIEQPSAIAWWFAPVGICHSIAEYKILLELLAVVDADISVDQDANASWLKLGLSLSQALAEFVANCRFLGAVRRENPQLAIAYLGLIALTQYWLQKILLSKLKVAAPTSL